MAAACCGIENNLGNLVTPVRQCFNWAEEKFLSKLPDLYVQVVLARDDAGKLVHTGVFIGDDLETYLAAARQAREQNITVLDEPLEKVVCVMQGDEFFSTWVANKAVYRTRMALADDGELVIICQRHPRAVDSFVCDPSAKKFVALHDADDLFQRLVEHRDVLLARLSGCRQIRLQIVANEDAGMYELACVIARQHHLHIKIGQLAQELFFGPVEALSHGCNEVAKIVL